MPAVLVEDADRIAKETGKNRSQVICEIYALARSIDIPKVDNYVNRNPAEIGRLLQKERDIAQRILKEYYDRFYEIYIRLKKENVTPPWAIWATDCAKQYGIDDMTVETLKQEFARRDAERTQTKINQQ